MTADTIASKLAGNEVLWKLYAKNNEVKEKAESVSEEEAEEVEMEVEEKAKPTRKSTRSSAKAESSKKAPARPIPRIVKQKAAVQSDPE
jgi:hypothetical protein